MAYPGKGDPPRLNSKQLMDQKAVTQAKQGEVARAAERGELDHMKHILQCARSGECGVTDEDRTHWIDTAIVAAAKAGQLETASSLLFDYHAKPMSEDKVDGRTVLHWAAANGVSGLVTSLLDKKAMAEATSIDGDMPLHVAASGGHADVCGLFVDRGCKVDVQAKESKIPLHDAATAGCREACSTLLVKKANIQARTQPGNTALAMAVENGHTDVVQFLLEQKADVSISDRWKYTPLHKAVTKGYVEITEVLLKDKMVDIGACTEDKQTPLHCAVDHGHADVISMLIARKADITAAKNDGRTILHGSAARGDHAVCEALINGGAEVDVKDKSGVTPLACASSAAVALLLVEHDADVNSCTSKGETVLHAAASNGNHDIVSLLLDRKANAEAATLLGKTALHMALAASHTDAAKALVRRGAALGADDPANRGLTPVLAMLDNEQLQDELRSASRIQLFEEKLEQAETAYRDAQAEHVWLERLRERRAAGLALVALEAQLTASEETMRSIERLEELMNKQLADMISKRGLLDHEARETAGSVEAMKNWNRDVRSENAYLTDTHNHCTEERDTEEIELHRLRTGEREMEERCVILRERHGELNEGIAMQVEEKNELQGALNEAREEVSEWLEMKRQAANLARLQIDTLH